jgi:hypothetical protein
MLRRVALIRTDVREELSASFIRVTRIGELGITLAVTSNWRTLRRNTWSVLTKLHGVTPQKTPFFIVTAVKTSNFRNRSKTDDTDDPIWLHMSVQNSEESNLNIRCFLLTLRRKWITSYWNQVLNYLAVVCAKTGALNEAAEGELALVASDFSSLSAWKSTCLRTSGESRPVPWLLQQRTELLSELGWVYYHTYMQ